VASQWEAFKEKEGKEEGNSLVGVIKGFSFPGS
jgi:hypothetical protein